MTRQGSGKSFPDWDLERVNFRRSHRGRTRWTTSIFSSSRRVKTHWARSGPIKAFAKAWNAAPHYQWVGGLQARLPSFYQAVLANGGISAVFD